MSQFVDLKQIVYMVCGVNSFTMKSNSNSPELVKLWSDCAMSDSRWPNVLFDGLYEGESTSDTIILRELFGLWIFRQPLTQP